MSGFQPRRPGDRGGGFQQRPPGTGGNFPPPPSLPPGYLQNGYFDKDGYPLPEVIVDWPKAIAQSLQQARPQMTTAQLRGRFFGEVRRLEKRLQVTGDFGLIRADVLKLASYAESAKNKGKVPPLFNDFIRANLRWAANSEKDFKQGFVNHFECVVGYFPEVRG